MKPWFVLVVEGNMLSWPFNEKSVCLGKIYRKCMTMKTENTASIITGHFCHGKLNVLNIMIGHVAIVAVVAV